MPAALAFSRGETAGGGVFVWERNGRVRLFARAGSAPAWSPDGRRLAYVAPAELGATDLYVADADGSHRAPLTRSETSDESSPDWAPDGRSLVVDRDGTLVVVRADGAVERVLTAGREPAWSRSGKIAFVSDRAGSDELYVDRRHGPWIAAADDLTGCGERPVLVARRSPARLRLDRRA